jgi:hypothetical protein
LRDGAFIAADDASAAVARARIAQARVDNSQVLLASRLGRSAARIEKATAAIRNHAETFNDLTLIDGMRCPQRVLFITLAQVEATMARILNNQKRTDFTEPM